MPLSVKFETKFIKKIIKIVLMGKKLPLVRRHHLVLDQLDP